MFRIAFISLLLTTGACLTAMAQDTTVRTGGSGDQIILADGYQAELFARRLGHISALTRHADGTLYVADRDRGQIFRIQDRALDGVADITQALPYRFDRPSGLAFVDDRLIVADRNGLWKISAKAGTPSLIAPFANSGSTGDRHPILTLDKDHLVLGLNRTDGQARLLRINVRTGAATLQDQIAGRIIGFASQSATDDGAPAEPWILFTRAGETWFGQRFETARQIDESSQAILIDPLQAVAYLARPDTIQKTVATFAGLRDGGEQLVSLPGRHVSLGVMASDTRGLFVTDTSSGRIWRVWQFDNIVIEETIETSEVIDADPAEAASTPSVRPVLPKGSSISRASRIDSASTLPEAEAPSPNPSQSEPDDPSRR